MRKKRYLEKLEWVEKEINFLSEHSIGHSMYDEVERRAVLYSILTAVEAVMDIAAMLVKDAGLEVEDDYTNISKLVGEGVISEEEGDMLRRFNGLRNAVAHHYNHLDLRRVEEALDFVDELYRIAVKLVKTAESLLK